MESINSYLNDLAFELKHRNLSDEKRKDIIQEVASSSNSGEEARQNFGTPQEYAEQFPEMTSGKNSLKNSIFTQIGIILGIVWVLFTVSSPEKLGIPTGFGSILWGIIPAILIFFIGAIVDFIRVKISARKITKGIS